MLQEITNRVAGSYPSHQDMTRQLATFLTSESPNFFYILDPFSPKVTSFLTQQLLLELSGSLADDVYLKFACINCMQCFTPRLIFDSVLNSLAHHDPTWENTCINWTSDSRSNNLFNDSLDSFIHGLRNLYNEKLLTVTKKTEKDYSHQKVPSLKFVLLFDKAERLIKNLPDLIIPLTRLAELTKVKIVTIFVSDIPWEDLCPTGTAFDPCRICVKPPMKQEILLLLSKKFPTNMNTLSIGPYMSVLRPLFRHFLDNVYDVCSPFTTDPEDLGYIVAARWPGFVEPLLQDMRMGYADTTKAPSEDSRFRLTKLFNSSLTNAVEMLYPRLMNSRQWLEVNRPPHSFQLSNAIGQQLPASPPLPQAHDQGLELPKFSIFILVASFFASYNPPKTDIRMFGRSKDEKKRRRKGGSPRKVKAGTISKVPQRLLGPNSFPFDRLVALSGVLLDEYGADGKASIIKDKAEFEVHRMYMSSSTQELVAMQLLHCVTSTEKLDGSALFKTGIAYELALKLARDIGITLHDYMWDLL